MKEIARLRELLAEATPGPWNAAEDPSHLDLMVITSARDDGGPDFSEVADLVGVADAALIVAAVNTLPALLDRLEAAEAVVEAARDMRIEHTEPYSYGQHRIADALRRYDEVRRG